MPDGFPENMPYRFVSDGARELMAVLARRWADNNGTLVSTGSNSNYRLVPNGGYETLEEGSSFMFMANHNQTNNNATMTIILADGTEYEARLRARNSIYVKTNNYYRIFLTDADSATDRQFQVLRANQSVIPD